MLTHLRGKTYVLMGPVNIGLYLYGDGTAAAVDTGLDDGSGRRLLTALREQDLSLVHIINTHSHADHCGGNAFVQQRTEAITWAAPLEAAVIENPYLEPFYLYGGDPFAQLKTKFLMAKPSRVDKKLGDINVGLEPLQIIPLPGHAPEQVGVLTPDRVLFCADAFFPSVTLDKYYLPYHAQLGPTLATLAKLAHFEADIFVPAHGEVTTDIGPVLTANRQRLEEISELILNLLSEPLSREQIVAWFYRQKGIPTSTSQYFLATATISAHLTYLAEQGHIRPKVKGGILNWKRTDYA
ncbi:MAG TPA: MBL fold metallo-hydrolase [bacterium]|nr:MBL fold metallo-hydrolase [bacterium]